MTASIKYVLLLLLVYTNIFSGIAQNDSLAIYDLSVIREFPQTDSSMKYFQNDSVTISVLFKLNHLAKASKVTIQLGTAKDIGDIRDVQYIVTKHNSNYFLSNIGIENKIWGKSAVNKYYLNKQEHQNLLWLTAFAEDNSGNITEKKYFRLNND